MADDVLPISDDARKKAALALNLPSLLGPLASQPNANPAPPPPPPLAIAGRQTTPASPMAVNPVAPPTPAAPPIKDTYNPAASPMPQEPMGPLASYQANHPQPDLHGFKKGLDIVGQILAPGIEEKIPGSPGNYNLGLSRATKQEEAGLAIRGKQADIGRTQAETGAIPSQTAHTEAETRKLDSEIDNPPQQAEVTHTYVDDKGNEVAIMRDGTTKVLGGAQKKDSEQSQVTHTFVDDKGNAVGVLRDGTTKVLGKARPEKEQKPERTMMGVKQPDGTTKVIEVSPGMTIPKGAETVTALGKGPTADESRRADLANNMNENLGQLEDILNRRPELFGPLSGRMTSLKGTIGTGDPDVAALNTLKEQIGMAMVGAHAMRNAQHVESAANSIMNSFKNEPQAVKGAIAEARRSLQTFINDKDGAQAAPSTGAMIYARDEKGQLHQAPAGTALPKGWKQEQGPQ